MFSNPTEFVNRKHPTRGQVAQRKKQTKSHPTYTYTHKAHHNNSNWNAAPTICVAALFPVYCWCSLYLACICLHRTVQSIGGVYSRSDLQAGSSIKPKIPSDANVHPVFESWTLNFCCQIFVFLCFLGDIWVLRDPTFSAKKTKPHS